MIDILLHELLHLDEHKEECGVYLSKKQNVQRKFAIMLYNDFNKPYFRNYPDYVESIFCFDKLKELVVGLVTSSFICKIFID